MTSHSTSLTKTALFIALPLAAVMAMPSLAQDTTPSNGESKLIMITIENFLSGQPFSPTVVESHTADAAVLFKLGYKAREELVAVAEGGNTAMYVHAAAMNKDSAIGDAQLAIYTLPGQGPFSCGWTRHTHSWTACGCSATPMTGSPASPASMHSA